MGIFPESPHSMKLGIIGLGARMAHMVNNTFKAADPALRVVGVVDPNESKAIEGLPHEDRDAPFFHSLRELVHRAKPDALAIGTRCNLHGFYAVQAAKFGLPLFLEKPIATTMRQAINLEKAFERSRCEVVVSFPLRASPLLKRVKEVLDDGAVGRVEHLLAVNYVPYGNVYFDSWYRDYTITQGLFLQKATHDFDYLSILAGAPITRVAASMSQGRVYRDKATRNGAGNNRSAVYLDDIGTPESGMNEDSSSALLEFANGVKGVYTQVFYSKREAEARGATISGYNGTVSFDWYRDEIKRIQHHEPLTDIIKLGEGENHFGGDGVLGKNFIDVVREGACSISPITAGLQSVYACLAARESALKARFVKVRQLGAASSGKEAGSPCVIPASAVHSH
jgi:predicted dehydrogenase